MAQFFTDQIGRKIELTGLPKRIVSLVPSQTELLFHFGLEEEVVGLTKFCVYPHEMWRSKPRVGGTKNLHFDRIAELKPDLIIGNKEENERSQIEKLEKHFPVWMSDILTLGDAFEMMKSVGHLVGKEKQAEALVNTLKIDFKQPASKAQHPVPAAYLIWREPWMAAASSTFIDEMLRVAGYVNVFSHKKRYPEITLEELSNAKPKVVLLSSEPYPFQEKHVGEIHEHCHGTVVKLVDGELFSWYGSRLLKSATYFDKLHEEVKLEIE